MLAKECDICEPTVVNWQSFCSDICGEHLLASAAVIEGVGVNVEVVEALFVRRKADVGKPGRRQRVFGGIEVGTAGRKGRKGFLVAVSSQYAATLLPIIQQYIAPGSTVVSDCWATYNIVGQIGYTHLTLNHQIQFENPHNAAGTKRVGCWSVGRTLRCGESECGTARTQLSSYFIIEYMWRAQFSETPRIGCSSCARCLPHHLN